VTQATAAMLIADNIQTKSDKRGARLYVWGKNKGYLIAGRDNPEQIVTPVIIPFFNDKKIASISAGYCHAIVATGTTI